MARSSLQKDYYKDYNRRRFSCPVGQRFSLLRVREVAARKPCTQTTRLSVREVGHENDDPRDNASPQNPLEHLIASLSNGYKFSKTSRRKLTDPVSVLQNGNPVLEPSPVEEMQAYPEEFSKWVKGQAVFLRNHGGCTVSKLCNMVTKYETATYGWLAVRPPTTTRMIPMRRGTREDATHDGQSLQVCNI